LVNSGITIALKDCLYQNIPPFWRLNYSQRFLTDYLVGLLIVLNFTSFRAVQSYFSLGLYTLAPAIRFLAGYTFSLYLYHFPIMMFCSKIFPNSTNSLTYYLMTVMVVFSLCLLVGQFTEKQKWVVRALLMGAANVTGRIAGRERSTASIS